MLEGVARRLGAGWASIGLGMLLTVVLSGWLLAAPPAASPDDSYHLGSIWCADGFKDDICVEAIGIADESVALVPENVLSLACFAYDGARSAACQDEIGTNAPPTFTASVTNINGTRPNLYYRTMHLLIGDGQDVAAAANRIRAANIVLTVAMVVLTGLVAHYRLRRAFTLSWLVTVVPLGLFFATSLSTSAWSIAGLSTVWANLVTMIDHPLRRNRIFGGVLAVTGISMGLGARTEAIAHIAVAMVGIGAMWFLRQLRNRRGVRSSARFRVAQASGAILALGGFGWLLSTLAPESADLDGISGGFTAGYARIEARNVGEPFLSIIFEVPTLWSGAFGHLWGLGVLDTPIPSVASMTLMALFVALAAIGLQQGDPARTLGFGLIFVALIAMPTLSLLRSGLLVYESLQPRQFMAMVYPLLGLALYRLTSESPLTLGPAMRTALVAGSSFAHSIALIVTMQRHTNGLLPGFDGLPRHVALGREPEWWWATMPQPDVVWAIASIAYFLLIAAIVQQYRSDKASAVSQA